MATDCTTCVHLNEKGVEGCGRGESAEVFCMGGNYELWEGEINEFLESVRSDVPVEDESINIQNIAREKLKIGADVENASLFSSGKIDFIKVFPTPVDAVNSFPALTTDEFEKMIGRSLSTEELTDFYKTQENMAFVKARLDSGDITEEGINKLFEEVENAKAKFDARPKVEAEGFNGVKKSAEKKSDSCQGCIHHSRVGCFLGRYYDCVENNRYLFEGAVVLGSGGLEKTMEEAEINSASEYIDKMLDDF